MLYNISGQQFFQKEAISYQLGFSFKELFSKYEQIHRNGGTDHIY